MGRLIPTLKSESVKLQMWFERLYDHIQQLVPATADWSVSNKYLEQLGLRAHLILHLSSVPTIPSHI